MEHSLPFLLRTAGWLAGLIAGVGVLCQRRALSAGTAMALIVATAGMYLGGALQARLEVVPLLEALSSIGTESTGGRAPLALLMAGLLAMGWCRFWRLPMGATGDALAVAASTLIPFVRAACLANGCCLGVVCGSSAASALCLRVGITSAAFHQQVQQGLLSPTSTLSLPLHPLPAYYAVASLLSLAILLWQIRRGVEAGVPALTFCILQSVAILLLEPLRAIPRPSVLMTAIPLGVLAVAVAELIALAMSSPYLAETVDLPERQR